MPDEISPARLYGKTVRIHYNLHRCPRGRDPRPDEACWVVSTKVGSTWKVAGYVPALLIADAVFQVSKPGVQRIRAQGARAVVAWIVGTATNPNTPTMKRVTGRFDDWEGVGFNPFKADSFYAYALNEPVYEAPLVYVSGRKAVARLHTHNPSSGPGVSGQEQLAMLAEHLGENVDY